MILNERFGRFGEVKIEFWENRITPSESPAMDGQNGVEESCQASRCSHLCYRSSCSLPVIPSPPDIYLRAASQSWACFPVPTEEAQFGGREAVLPPVQALAITLLSTQLARYLGPSQREFWNSGRQQTTLKHCHHLASYQNQWCYKTDTCSCPPVVRTRLLQIWISRSEEQWAV